MVGQYQLFNGSLDSAVIIARLVRWNLRSQSLMLFWNKQKALQS